MELRHIRYFVALAESLSFTKAAWQMHVSQPALTKALRQQGMLARNGRPLPIIALTANAMSGEAEQCRQHGMDDYLTKPITLQQLSAILDKWLPPPGA